MLSVAAVAPSCPDADAFVALAEGRAPAAVREHVLGCAACLRVYGLLSGHASPVSATAPESASSIDSATRTTVDFSEPKNSFEPLASGTAMGRYILGPLVGVGAMGAVYAAHDPNLHREVAIKVLSAFASGGNRAGLQRRLLREARALARLAHPNVVTVYDVGLEVDRVFIVMELVRGVTLTQYAREHKPSRTEFLEMFMQAGRGLGAAHEAGLVHRDFKPDNVLIGDDGRVRVTDFGLAHGSYEIPQDVAPADAAPVDWLSTISGTRATRTGAIAGTPAYMAPEQRRGAADARSDQFSFCMALHEMLTGHRVTARDPVQIAGSLRGPLAAALRRGLDPDPWQRFENMSALLQALRSRANSPLRSAVWAAAGVSAAASLWFAGTLAVAHKPDTGPMMKTPSVLQLASTRRESDVDRTPLIDAPTDTSSVGSPETQGAMAPPARRHTKPMSIPRSRSAPSPSVPAPPPLPADPFDQFH